MRASTKLLQVAERLGLTDLRKMQASTGVIFDTIAGNVSQGTFFQNVSQRTVPFTNLSDNRFEQNEAFLVEGMAIYLQPATGATGPTPIGQSSPPVNIRANMVIANSTVLKDILLGSTIPSSNTFKAVNITSSNGVFYIRPGIVIPPNVTFSVDFISDTILGDADTIRIGCVLYGTRVLTNLGTSI